MGFWEISQDDGGELIAAASGAFRSTWDNPFRDVPPGAWYEEAVQYVYEAGLMQGTTGSTFSPDRASNRGMIAAILYRLEGRPRAGTPPFTDVAADSYCADAVAWAEQQGIVRGFDDGTFRPEGRITASSWRPILFRYTEYQGSGYRGPDGPEPLLRQRRCGGLCPGGPGLGGVCPDCSRAGPTARWIRPAPPRAPRRQ